MRLKNEVHRSFQRSKLRHALFLISELLADLFFLQEMPRRFNVPRMHGGGSVLTWKPGRRSRG